MERPLDDFLPGRTTMQKFSLYFACFLTLILMGCGDTSGDPTARITLEADKTDVAPGSSAVITATVTKAIGTKAEATTEAVVVAPGWGENVTFKLLTANGGQLSTPVQKTDGDGKARSVYTSGNNYNNDTIQATLDNGMSATIVIKKTGTTIGAIISSFVASPTTVAEGQTSVITAKVTDGNSANPMIGEAVTFNMATNESGACFINATNACVASVTVNSDAGGNAVAVYRAGSSKSTEELHDTVRAGLANGSSNAVLITRSAGPAGAVLALAASPTSVNGGQTSVITATVTGGTNSGANEVVTLTIPVNESGASFINAAGVSVSTITITTGSGGIASAIYKAGTNDSGTIVQDTVQGVLSNGAMSAVMITRNAGVTGYVVTVTANPSTLTTQTGSSIVTANVRDNTGIAVVGTTVTFNKTGAGGQLTPASASTDTNGNAITVFTGAAPSGAAIVQATTMIGGNNYTGAVAITVP
ncbi:MAG TPA: hypothetical protein DCZ97_01700 [Syntrophus sp. (in: bacteria)]|nr:hypothetical protein [Syntrophus sp. (in: bacteria)]